MVSTLSLTVKSRPETRLLPIQRSGSGPLQHFTTLDGLRGVAILAVLIVHYNEHFVPDQGRGHVLRTLTDMGYLGVTLFFVLSGFLITRILVRTRDDPRYFATFFKRRSLRIFPLYFAYLAFVCLSSSVLGDWLGYGQYRLNSHSFSYLIYTNNIGWGLGYDHPSLIHLWSLAIEEQFYLAWPFVIYFIPNRWLIPLCVAGFIGSFAYRVALLLANTGAETVYAATPSRIDGLLIGAAIGVMELNEVARARLSRWIRPVMIACLIALTPIVLRDSLIPFRRLVQTVGWSLCAILFATIVFWAVTSGAKNRWLNARWLRFMGKYSYGIYVLHMVPALAICRDRLPTSVIQQVSAMLACVAATAVLTALSWHFVESPFLRRKNQMTSVK